MRRLLVSPLVLLFLVAACEDSGPSPMAGPGDLGGPLFSLQQEEVEGFFFLPPVVSNPEAIGDPDMGWSPEVVVCLSPGGSDECPEDPDNTFDATPENEHYEVNWSPGEDSGASNGDTWRIEVYVAGFRLGFLDVTFVQNARQGQGIDGVVLVGTDRTVPIRFRIEEGAVAAAAFASECEIGGEILDCDVQEGDPDTELQSKVVDPDETDHDAGFLKIPVGSAPGKYISIFKHIAEFSEGPFGLPGTPRPYFLSVQVFDEDGNPIQLDPDNPALLTLCLKDDPATGEFSLLRIFRVIPGTGGQTEILDTDHDDTECGLAPNSASLFKGRLSPLNRVAGLFRAQPLGALHGGLNTTRDTFSEFGAVLAEEAPFGYGTEFDWENMALEASGSGPAPFFTPGDFSVCPHLDDTGDGTGGAGVWPIGTTAPGGGTVITLTKSFLVPSGATGLRVWAAIDNDIKVILNGVDDITHTFDPQPGAPTGVPASSFATGLDPDGFLRHEGCAWLDSVHFTGNAVDGVNTIEVIARDRGTIGYVNVRVEAVFPSID
jgi:hypothetical protein